MVLPISSGLEASILTLYQLNYSSRKIVSTLIAQNQRVSKTTVLKVCDKYETKRNGILLAPVKKWNRGTPKLRNPALILKVKRNINVASPPSITQLAKDNQVSKSTIQRIIKQDIEGKLKKKYHVHALSDKQIFQRLQRGPHFLGFLGSTRLRYILTVDEAWVYLDTTNGVRRVYYEIKGARTPESWTKFCKKSHPVGVMFFAGICWRGVTTLRFIEPGAKINSDYYIKHCLKPLIEVDIPHLYPGEEHKVVFHQDSAPAHASKKTQKYLLESGIKFIPAEQWMGNSPDLAPMDYAINGKFKWNLFDREANTLNGLKRVMTAVWSEIPLDFIQKTLLAWPKRVELMIERGGLQIEHVLKGKKTFL